MAGSQPSASHPRTRLGAAWDALFNGQPEVQPAWVWPAVLAALYLGGLVFWGVFFHWGDFPYKFHDWAEVNAARMAFVRDAVSKGMLPLHMPDSSALRGLTDRFLVLPDVITAPQMILMPLMSLTQFFLLDVLFMYSLGTLGLLWFKRRFALSPVAFALLFLAFQFNGQIQAHLAVGHATWLGYFLFPAFLALVMRLVDAPQGWRWVAAVAFLLFFMLLQGSFHQFIWCLMFLALVGVATYRRLATVLAAGLFSGLLSAVRLLPPALGLGQFSDQFLSGYPRPWDVLTALIRLIGPAQALADRMQWAGLGWWEYDLYLGLAGTLLVGYFGFVLWLWNQRREKQYWQILAAAAVLAILAMWKIYKPLTSLPIPFLNAERVSSRLIILPFVAVIIMAAVNLQRWLEKLPARFISRLGLVVMLGLLGWDLVQHLLAWQETEAVKGFPFADVNLAIKVVSNHPDPQYFAVAGAGAAITVLTGVFLLGMVWRERRQKAAGLIAVWQKK